LSVAAALTQPRGAREVREKHSISCQAVGDLFSLTSGRREAAVRARRCKLSFCYAILTATVEPAGMAKLADAADLKSAGPKGLSGFDSPSRHQPSH